MKETKIQNQFLHIISKGNKDNTYKFALAKFLLDFSKTNKVSTNIEISYQTIAEAFLKYYWYQECKYKIKQDFKKQTKPVVIGIIQKYCGTDYIPLSYEKYFKKNDKSTIEKEIEKECLRDVIPRFQPKDEPILIFNHNHSISINGKKFNVPDKNKRYITLNKEAHQYFKENYDVLNKLLVLEWAKFLEKTNFTPRLISKIESFGTQKRSSLTKYRKILEEIDCKCFYCDIDLATKKVHVDHFVPWSYIFEDEIWNLVLSCDTCNLQKSDSLVRKEFLEKIIERNKQNSFVPINKDIEEIYHNCEKAGFLKTT